MSEDKQKYEGINQSNVVSTVFLGFLFFAASFHTKAASAVYTESTIASNLVWVLIIISTPFTHKGKYSYKGNGS